MAHSDERRVYHMIFHGLQYCYSHTEYPISYPHVTHIRLPWTFKAVSDMMFVPFNLPSVPGGCPWPAPPLSQDYLEHSRLSLMWSISGPQFQILKSCCHGDILGSPKDVPELQWYYLVGQVSVLLTYDGSHASQGCKCHSIYNAMIKHTCELRTTMHLCAS